jgi:hypothetical protein
LRYLLLDAELDVLAKVITTIDQQLDEVIQESTRIDDPDSFGYFDIAEQLTGLAFVACQTYMATVYGYLRLEKQKALTMGARHSGGLTKVEIINHAANYWKHNNEWSIDRSVARRNAIEKAFESVGFPVGTDYPLSGVLTEVASPNGATFRPVLNILESWKAALCDAA